MKKLSNKILLVGLVVLVGIFVASRFFRSPGLESNLRKDLLKLDTASISEVRILPSKEHGEELRLTRTGNEWKVIKGNRQEPTGNTSIKGLLISLAGIKVERLASRKKEKWEEFNVGDNSTHVTVYADGKKTADFHVGKLGFAQNGGGNFGGSYTYIRLSDENEVYTVEGFLESTFNNSFNDWRDKTLLKLNKDVITKISFLYPTDSGFVAEKRDSIWYIGQDKTDVAKTESFLNTISSKYMSAFDDGFTPVSKPDMTMQVDGKVGNLLKLEAWKKDETEWILTSSQQKNVYFSSKGSSGVSDIFIGRKKMQ
jgi:Domain of unknown function (DUF4340)